MNLAQGREKRKHLNFRMLKRRYQAKESAKKRANVENYFEDMSIQKFFYLKTVLNKKGISLDIIIKDNGNQE